MNRKYFTISQFARFARTTRNTLIHYENKGLINPISRGDNNYRSYSVSQIANLNLIRTLQELGMTLEEIKQIKDSRTPELMENILTQQIDKIEIKIDRCVQAQKLLHTLRKIIRSVNNIDENEIYVQFHPAEAIVLGEINDYSRGRNDYDALRDFYRSIGDKYPSYDLNYPVWAIFSKERIRRGDWNWPERFYFYNPEGHDKKPAGSYVVGYTRGGYGDCGSLYRRLLDYIETNNLEINGDIYEEYPLNEISINDNSNYLIRVMIPIRERISLADV